MQLCEIKKHDCEKQSVREIKRSKDVVIMSLMAVNVALFCLVIIQRMISEHLDSSVCACQR